MNLIPTSRHLLTTLALAGLTVLGACDRRDTPAAPKTSIDAPTPMPSPAPSAGPEGSGTIGTPGTGPGTTPGAGGMGGDAPGTSAPASR